MKTKSNALAVFAREKHDTVFELAYQGRSKEYARRRMRELRQEGCRVAGAEIRSNARGQISVKILR